MLRARLAEIFTEWVALLGEGNVGWTVLANILDRLTLEFAIEIPEVVKT